MLCMGRPTYILPLLVISTAVYAIEVVIGIVGSLVATFFFSMMFGDSPGVGSQAWSVILPILIPLVVGIPLILCVLQWALYRYEKYAAAAAVACVGLIEAAILLLRALVFSH